MTAHALLKGSARIMIDGLTNSGSMPVLERMMQFTAQRQDILTHNIANLSTPNFRPVDVSVPAFQQQLHEAVDRRRNGSGQTIPGLRVQGTQEVEVHGDDLRLQPQPVGENVLFHDGNDRDVERTMQKLVENFLAFRTAAQLFKGQVDLLNVALRERL